MRLSDYLRRWCIDWAYLAVGLIGVVTLGWCRPRWQLSAAEWYAKNRITPDDIGGPDE